MTVSDLIHRGITRAGGSQNAFARYMEVTPNAVAEWRDGRAIPGFDKVPRLTGATGLAEDVIQKVLIQARIERDLQREVTMRRLLTELPRKRRASPPQAGRKGRPIRGGGSQAQPRPAGGDDHRVGLSEPVPPQRLRRSRPESLLSDVPRAA